MHVHQHSPGPIRIHRRRDNRLRRGLIALRSFSQLPKTEPKIVRNGAGKLGADIESSGEKAEASEKNFCIQGAAMETGADYAT